MNKYTYAGIDYSLTCPAITVGNKKDFAQCKSFFYTNTNKYVGAFGNVYGLKMQPYESEIERYDNLSEWAIAILLKFGVRSVIIEGYSMGSKGRVFHIAENTGILLYKLWLNGIEFRSVAPTSLKKSFSGKGNSNKEQMVESFIKQTSIQLPTKMDCAVGSSPVADVVDSYAAYLENFKS